MAGLTDTVELDLAEALRGIDTIEAALTAATQSFKVGVVDALSVLSQVEVGADASQVTAAVDAAVGATDATVAVDADVAGIAPAVDDAVAAADATVPVEASAAGLAGVTSDISAAVAQADDVVVIDADTSAAVAAVEDLGNASQSSEESVGGLNVGAKQLAAVAGVAAGEVGRLTEALPEGPEFGAAAAGLTALGVAATAAFRASEESEVAERRFASTTGDLADQIRAVNVGGLAGDLTDLATRAGSSDERLKIAVARIAELGRSSGASSPQIAQVAQNVEALALRASVANPTLGEAGDIADRLTNAFLRGGRALTPFGIALTAAQINAQALATSGKTATDELTVFDKQAAGAALAVAQLGDNLGRDFAAGAEQGTIQIRAVKEEFNNALEVLGKPLLEPTITAIREGEPVIVGLASVFSDIATHTLPILETGLRAAEPALEGLAVAGHGVAEVFGAVGKVIDLVPAPVLQSVAAFGIYLKVLREVESLAESAAIKTGLLVAAETAEAAEKRVLAAAEVEEAAARAASTGANIGATAATGALAGTFGVLNAAILPIAAGLALGTIALANHRKEQEATKRSVNELAAAFEDQSTSFQEDIDKLVENKFSGLTENLNQLGLTFDDLNEFATRGDEGVIAFVQHLEDSGQASEGATAAFRKSREEGHTFGQAFNRAANVMDKDFDPAAKKVILALGKVQANAQDAAKKTVLLAKAHGDFTPEALNAAEANNALAEGGVDYVAVLRELIPDQEKAADGFAGTANAADAAATATAEALDQFVALTVQQDPLLRGLDLTGDGLLDLIDKFNAGTLSPTEFSTALSNTSDTAEELTAALKAGSDAVDTFNSSIGDDLSRALDEAGPALGGVIDSFVRGTLSADEFLRVIDRTGIPADKLQAALNQAKQSVDSFVDSALGKLPTIDDAFDEVAKQPGIDGFVKKVEGQADSLASHKGLTAFADGVKRDLSALAAQPGGLDAFLRKTEAGARALGKQPGLDAFVRKVKRQAADLSTDTGLEAFLKKIEKQATDTAAFIDNIATLRNRGATGLAETFLTAGPEKAAADAAEAARLGAKGLAAQEKRFDASQAVTERAQAKERRLAQEFGLEMLGIQTDNYSLLANIKAPDLTVPLITAEERAADSLRTEGHRLLRQAADAAVTGLGVSANQLTAVHSAGQQLGRELATGVVEGTDTSADELFRAGERAAAAVDAGLRAHLEMNSPSRVGIRRGANYTESVALGLGVTDPIDRAMAVVADRVSRPFVGVASVAVAPVASAGPPAAAGGGGFGGSAAGDGRLVAETAAMRAQGLETLVLLRRLVDAAGGIGDATADAIRRTGTDGRFLPAAMRT